MRKIYSILPLFVFIISVSCSSFVRDDEVVNIKSYEVKAYSLKQDAGEGDRQIRAGQKVKLYMVSTGDFIKVYCYPAEKDFVKADRTLLLYFFKEDFKNKKFDAAVFDEKVNSVVKPVE